MPDRNDLPFLLRLLEDRSTVVQQAVARELSGFGKELDAELDRLAAPPGSGQRVAIAELLHAYRRDWLKEHWPQWRSAGSSAGRLETAMGLIAQFQYGPEDGDNLGALLDELAERFRASGAEGAVALAEFLFVKEGLKGARADYYNPWNTNLVYVIRHRKGIPLSLACVYLLVGDRLGLPIYGCNWPGHFYARTESGGVTMLVDCYHDGQCVEEESFLRMQGPSRRAAERVLKQQVQAETIIARALHNLVRAYQQSTDPGSDSHWEDSLAIMALLRGMGEEGR